MGVTLVNKNQVKLVLNRTKIKDKLYFKIARERLKQTNRHMCRKRDGGKTREQFATNRQTHKQTHRYIDRYDGSLKGERPGSSLRLTDKHTNKPTDKQTDMA